MEWLVLLLALGSTAPQTTTVEPVATRTAFNAAGVSTPARGWTTSDRNEARNAIMRLQIARRTH
jgi:hypothetical protein